MELFHLFLSVGAFLMLLFSQLFVLLSALQVLGHSIVGWLFILWREKMPRLHAVLSHTSPWLSFSPIEKKCLITAVICFCDRSMQFGLMKKYQRFARSIALD